MDLSKFELDQLQAAFVLFDVDKSGRVPASEIKKSLLEVSSVTDRPNIYRILMQLDLKGNALLSFEDFAKLFSSGSATLLKGGQVTRKEAQRLFRLIDVENKGKISYRDLKRLTDELNEPITPKELEEMIHRADSTGDGLIDLDEFYRIISVRDAASE